ncbi:MAG: hypothetical protein U5L45_13545 [Saprospiraceae bacterium]|nr:hypothetical protein [Saprospiraceae bacterium]
MTTRTRHNTFNAKAFFLALLIFTAFGGKELHVLLEHTHSNLEVCHVQKGETHLHAYEQLEHGCALCDFTFSYFELELPFFFLKNTQINYKSTLFTYISFKYSNLHLFQSLRAPPVLGVV